MKNKLKRILVTGLILCMSVVCLAGCKKNIDKMSDEELYNYMNSFESEEELDKWYETLNEDQKERAEKILLSYGLMDLFGGTSDTKESKTKEEEKKDNGPLKYEASDEIINASFTDFKFQIDDTVITVNYGGKVSDFLSQFDENTYKYTDGWRNDISTDELIPPGKYGMIYVFNKNQPKTYGEMGFESNEVLTINFENNGEETCEVGDCTLSGFCLSDEYNGSIYVAKGIPIDYEALAADERFTYDNIEAYLSQYVDRIVEDGLDVDNDIIGTTILSKNSGGLEYCLAAYASEEKSFQSWDSVLYPGYVIHFCIDPNTRGLSDIYIEFSDNSV